MTRKLTLGLAALSAVAFAACNDSNVPYYTAPTSVSNTPSGIQNAVTGLVSAIRGNDLFSYLVDATGYARDGANYTNTEPRFILYELGLEPTDPAWSGAWPEFYTNILQSHQIMATLPQVLPAYTAAQSAAIIGVLQTLEALNYILVAEDHDTDGVAIMPQAPTTAPPGYCIKDGWKYIVALLDSANSQLMTAGATPLPVKLPDGFKSVSSTGTTFSSFNRALQGKALLELAYAIARSSPGTAPGPNSAGSPDITSLTRADSAIKASSLYNPAALAPPSAGGFTNDAYSVLHNFSSTSGDISNPFNQNIGTYIVLNTIPNSQDTLHDLRWLTKFVLNPNPVQQPGYAAPASAYIYGMYPSPSSYIPIVRNEELNLVEAEIQIGLGNYTTAANIIENVRTTVGGPNLKSGFQADTFIRSAPTNSNAAATDTVIIPAVDPTSYTSVRDFLLREQQISTAFEGSADRMIAIRMYGLAAQLDTTWGSKDLHTTVDPIPFAEISARGGSFPKACP
jgi:hypothetical protein